MAHIIVVGNEKGGAGKSTVTMHVATSLARMDYRVGAVDLDLRQQTFGRYCANRRNHLTEIGIELKGPSFFPLPEIDKETIPEGENIFDHRLSAVISKMEKTCDYIFIDCAPSLGLITLNALSAADSVLIPIQCEYFALEGLGKLLNTIKSIQKIHNKDLDIEGLLLTMYDSRLRLSNQVVEEVKKHFGKMVFKSIIQRNIRLSEAPSFGENIIQYDATCKGAQNYLSLAQEVLKKNKGK